LFENLLFSLTYESFSFNVQRPSQASTISEQLRHLRRKFSDRTDTIKEIIHQAPDYDRDRTSSYIYRLKTKRKMKLLFFFLLRW
jgi:hypothetical protein